MIQRFFIAALLLITLLSANTSPSLLNAQDATLKQLNIYRVVVKNTDDLNRLMETGLDVLEMSEPDAEGRALFVQGTERAAQQLREAGFAPTLDKTISLAAPFTDMSAQSAETYARGYRTVDEHYAHLDQIAAMYPALAKVVSYGQSWRRVNGKPNGYELKVICITQRRKGDCALDPNADKPRMLLMAAIHARELTTAEIAWRWIDYLTSQYGINADVNYLLNTTEIWVIPLANPDGRHIVEQGGAAPYTQRKNANTSSGSCAYPPTDSSQHGVDLNRNASFMWGVIGASTLPCSLLYRGAHAAAESEESALETLLRQLFKDAHQGSINTATPYTQTGVMLSLHSYSNLVLLPWGWTACNYAPCTFDNLSPDDEQLRALAFRMSFYNGYQTGQSSEVLYPVSGSTDDWAYGVLGVAAFTFEIGSAEGTSCGGFMPSYVCVDGLFAKNLPALMYAAKVAHAPYVTPLGPTIVQMALPQRVAPSMPITLSVRASDDTLGNGVSRPTPLPIIRVEYSIDAVNVQPMSARDGEFDGTTEWADATLTAPSAVGQYVLYTRACNALNRCGTVTAQRFFVGDTVYLPLIAK